MVILLALQVVVVTKVQPRYPALGASRGRDDGNLEEKRQADIDRKFKSFDVIGATIASQ